MLLMGAVAFGFASCGIDDDDDYGNSSGGSGGSGGSGSVTSYTHCPDSHHPHAIDLGLPSGTKWACCNVGASSPEADGDYFAWGETKSKSNYSWGTYKWGSYDSDGNEVTTKYNDSDGKNALDAADDAATQNWGKGWRMPTTEEFKELADNCDGYWIEENGVKGYKFTSTKTTASIFFPASGYRGDYVIDYHDYYGCYWSSWRHYSDCAFALNFVSGIYGDLLTDDLRREYGHSVRAVCP